MIFLRFLRYFCWSGVYNGPPLYEIISTTSKWFIELRIDVKAKTQWYNYLFKVINKNTWLMYWRKPCTACSEWRYSGAFIPNNTTFSTTIRKIIMFLFMTLSSLCLTGSSSLYEVHQVTCRINYGRYLVDYYYLWTISCRLLL